MTALNDGHRGTLADRIYGDLRTRIVAGEIPPRGIVREADVARGSGASRTPVREALHRLEAEGFISRAVAGAYAVTELSVQELEDIYELRGILEGHAARLAAERRGRVELAKLADVMDSMEEALAVLDAKRLLELNGALHDLVAECSGSRYLQTQVRTIRELFERYRSGALSNPARRNQAHDEHKRLVAAIRHQDGDAAESIARGHAREAIKHRLDGTSPTITTAASVTSDPATPRPQQA